MFVQRKLVLLVLLSMFCPVLSLLVNGGIAQDEIEVRIEPPGIQLDLNRTSDSDGNFVVDPDAPNSGSIGKIVFGYQGKDYTLIPLNDKPRIRVVQIGEERAGFVSFLFQGSLVLPNQWSVRKALGNSMWADPLTRLSTTSRFRKVNLNSAVTLYTTEGVRGGAIEVILFFPNQTGIRVSGKVMGRGEVRISGNLPSQFSEKLLLPKIHTLASQQKTRVKASH